MDFEALITSRRQSLLGLCLVVMAWMVQVSALQAQDGVFTPFFRFFDSPPEIHLPHPEIHLPRLDIVPFWTSDLKSGRDAYAKGDYERARGAFLRASDEGNIVADWYLAHMYRLGHGVPLDAAIAYSYFKRVADTYTPDEPDPYRLRITVDARIRVADYLRIGIASAHLAANPQSAAHTYLEMATNYGHPRALYGLGVMSIAGEGMKQNPSQGLKWLYAATRKHSSEAAAYLGELCSAGQYVPQDEAKALTWYMIAASYANKDESPQIFARLSELKFAASDDTRLEAEARARVWNEQNPGDPTP